jgi:excisionase family DNA binding protein
MGIDTGIRDMIKEEVEKQVRLTVLEELNKRGLSDGQAEKGLTPYEVAEQEGVSVDTVRRWRRNGLASVGRGRMVRIARADLEAFRAGEKARDPEFQGMAPAERGRILAEKALTRILKKAGG